MGPIMSGPVILGFTLVTAALAWYYFRKRLERKSTSAKGLQKLLDDPQVKHELQLIEKFELSHNTRRFRFQLPEDTCLGLNPGQHINVSAVINGSLVVRTYSPVSTNQDIGFMEIIVKVYFSNTHPQFPNGGKMSQFLNNMNPGDSIHIRGPAGQMVYNADDGEFLIRSNKKLPERKIRANQINMIAGGSGITPMLQILNAVFNSCESESVFQEETTVCLIFANQTEDDILCRSYIENISKKYYNRLKVWYTLTQPPQGWSFGIGRVSRDMFQAHLFPPSSNGIQLLCGPTPMTQSCISLLYDLDYNPARCYTY